MSFGQWYCHLLMSYGYDMGKRICSWRFCSCAFSFCCYFSIYLIFSLIFRQFCQFLQFSHFFPDEPIFRRFSNFLSYNFSSTFLKNPFFQPFLKLLSISSIFFLFSTDINCLQSSYFFRFASNIHRFRIDSNNCHFSLIPLDPRIAVIQHCHPSYRLSVWCHPTKSSDRPSMTDTIVTWPNAQWKFFFLPARPHQSVRTSQNIHHSFWCVNWVWLHQSGTLMWRMHSVAINLFWFLPYFSIINSN